MLALLARWRLTTVAVRVVSTPRPSAGLVLAVSWRPQRPVLSVCSWAAKSPARGA